MSQNMSSAAVVIGTLRVRISMELSILYFKGLPVKISLRWSIFVTQDCFYIKANSKDPQEMTDDAAFYLGLHCLLKVFTYVQY